MKSNIENLIEIESIIKENNLIEDWMKIENYDIAKLNNNKKSDFKKILNEVNNSINKKFYYYEYHDKLEKIGLYDKIIANNREHDNNYKKSLDEELFNLMDEIIDNYLNIYKKDDLSESYENISDDNELLNEIYLYNKLYKNNNKKSHKNIKDEFNEIGNFTLNDDDDDDDKNKEKN